MFSLSQISKTFFKKLLNLDKNNEEKEQSQGTTLGTKPKKDITTNPIDIKNMKVGKPEIDNQAYVTFLQL